MMGRTEIGAVELLERARWYVQQWNLAQADDDSRKLLMDIAALGEARAHARAPERCVCGDDREAHEIRDGQCPTRLGGRWELASPPARDNTVSRAAFLAVMLSIAHAPDEVDVREIARDVLADGLQPSSND